MLAAHLCVCVFGFFFLFFALYFYLYKSASALQQLSSAVFFKLMLVWSDDDWLKKFSGKTLQENEAAEGTEAPKPTEQEVTL